MLAIALAASGSSGAAPLRPLDPWSLSLGVFDTNSDTTLRASARSGDDSADGHVNLERDLGLDRRQPVSQARLDLLVGDHNGFGLEYFGFERGNTVRLARDIADRVGQSEDATEGIQAVKEKRKPNWKGK